MVALGLGRVDHDDLGVGPERGAEAEPEVERDADHERDVRPASAGAARPREEQLVVGGHAAAGEAVEEHRDPQLLGERAQRVLAAAPVQAGPGHDHRALGVAQQRRGALDRARVGGACAWRLGAGAAVASPARRRLGEHEVEREVEERRARVRRQRRRDRLVDEPRDLRRRPARSPRA